MGLFLTIKHMKTRKTIKKTELITLAEVRKIAVLAMLPISEVLITKFHPQLALVLEYVSKIQKIDTDNVAETSQVTKLENVFREDVVDRQRMFSQTQALSNAKRIHDGYFVVNAIIK